MSARAFQVASAIVCASAIPSSSALALPEDLQAERVELSAAGWRAEALTWTLGQAEITARQATQVGDGPILILDGEWRGPQASASFARAEIEPDLSEIRLFEVDFRPCACDGAEPWGLRAATVSLHEDVARVGRPTLVLFGRPLLPIPSSPLPLRRRSGLLAPTLGGGQDGVVLTAPAYLTLGRSADLTLTPELRTSRGPRLINEARYALRSGSGELRLDGAYDRLRRRARGAARWEHRAATDDLRAATSIATISDPWYWRDYEDRRLDRLLPFTTSRALVGSRHFEAHAFGAAQSARQGFGLLQGAALLPWTPLGGGLLARGSASLSGMARWQEEDPRLSGVGVADLSLERPTWLGPLRLTPSVEGGAWLAPSPDRPAGVYGATGAEAALPLWSSSASGLLHLEPLVGARIRTGRPGLRYALARSLPTAVYGGLRARRTFTGGGLIEALGQGMWTEEGLSPHAELRIERSAVRFQGAARLGGPDPLAWAELDLDPGPVAVRGRAVHHPDPETPFQLGGVDVIFRPGPVEIGIGLDSALDHPHWLSRRAWAAWTHPTGCLRLGLSARVDDDRALPDVALLVDVFPAR